MIELRKLESTNTLNSNGRRETIQFQRGPSVIGIRRGGACTLILN